MQFAILNQAATVCFFLTLLSSFYPTSKVFTLENVLIHFFDEPGVLIDCHLKKWWAAKFSSRSRFSHQKFLSGSIFFHAFEFFKISNENLVLSKECKKLVCQRCYVVLDPSNWFQDRTSILKICYATLDKLNLATLNLKKTGIRMVNLYKSEIFEWLSVIKLC